MSRLLSRSLDRVRSSLSILKPLVGVALGACMGLAHAQVQSYDYSNYYWDSRNVVSVLTHHNDGWRTGWNNSEKILTTARVAATGGRDVFGLQGTVALDGLVEMQPLVVPYAYVYGDPNAGRHDVVYVATANNTVYAIDPITRKVLKSRNLGTPMSAFPGCADNDKVIGVNSTPVIDTNSNSLYVIAHVKGRKGAEMHLHRLSLSNLNDMVAPVLIAAKAPLTNGSYTSFDANYQRQRAALLLSNGRVTAAFTSHCDMRGDIARGWVMQWDQYTLDKPRSYYDPTGKNAVFLTDKQATGPSSFFMSTVWMSGSGPAVDENGSVYFATGNSDPGALREDGTGFVEDGVTNVGQSVVKLSPDNRIQSFFMPSNVMQLDNDDMDLGSGGVLLVPNSSQRFALQSGKDGILRLMSRDNLGGFTRGGPDKVLASTVIGHCMCSPSYYYDGTPRVVSSGGTTLAVYAIKTKPYALVKQGSAEVYTGQWGGFFTSVSSNGVNDPIIWAVGRPQTIPGDIYLYAYSGKPTSGGALPLLYSTTAGTWNSQGNANVVPTVANGRVYVAGYKQLSIFGLGGKR